VRLSIGEKTNASLIVMNACLNFNVAQRKIMMNGEKKLQPPTDEEIARYAYYLWESEGCIHGRDMDYWLQAKTHLTTTREYEAGLLKNAESQQKTPVKGRLEIAAAARSAIDAQAKASKKRQARAAREPAYA
jgi:hypothetical protein